MNSKNIAIIIDNLSKKISSGTLYIYNINLEAIKAYIVLDILGIIISMMGIVALCYIVIKSNVYLLEKDKFMRGVIIIGLIILLGFLAANISDLIYCLFSPNYWAMKNIINTIATFKN